MLLRRRDLRRQGGLCRRCPRPRSLHRRWGYSLLDATSAARGPSTAAAVSAPRVSRLFPWRWATPHHLFGSARRFFRPIHRHESWRGHAEEEDSPGRCRRRGDGERGDVPGSSGTLWRCLAQSPWRRRRGSRAERCAL